MVISALHSGALSPATAAEAQRLRRFAERFDNGKRAILAPTGKRYKAPAARSREL
ncbi:hypothetical protein MKFW12EY_03550 [Methylomonas koyamae]|nr:hypothetical protein MKFW12EY_03550 [Methylomonas koyamae]